MLTKLPKPIYEIGMINMQITLAIFLYFFLSFIFSKKPYPDERAEVKIAVIMAIEYIVFSIGWHSSNIAKIGISMFFTFIEHSVNIWYMANIRINIIVPDIIAVILYVFLSLTFEVSDIIIGIKVILL